MKYNRNVLEKRKTSNEWSTLGGRTIFGPNVERC